MIFLVRMGEIEMQETEDNSFNAFESFKLQYFCKVLLVLYYGLNVWCLPEAPVFEHLASWIAVLFCEIVDPSGSGM